MFEIVFYEDDFPYYLETLSSQEEAVSLFVKMAGEQIGLKESYLTHTSTFILFSKRNEKKNLFCFGAISEEIFESVYQKIYQKPTVFKK